MGIRGVLGIESGGTVDKSLSAVKWMVMSVSESSSSPRPNVSHTASNQSDAKFP